MEQQLDAWQKKHNKGPTDKPYGNTWYRDLRIEGIKAKDVTGLDTSYNRDICRSWLNNVVAKREAKLKKEAEDAIKAKAEEDKKNAGDVN